MFFCVCFQTDKLLFGFTALNVMNKKTLNIFLAKRREVVKMQAKNVIKVLRRKTANSIFLQKDTQNKNRRQSYKINVVFVPKKNLAGLKFLDGWCIISIHNFRS